MVVVEQKVLVMLLEVLEAEALVVKDLIIQVVVHLHQEHQVQVMVLLDRQTQAAEAAVVLGQMVVLMRHQVLEDQE